MKEIGEITMLQGLKFGTKMQRLVRKLRVALKGYRPWRANGYRRGAQ